MHCFLRPCLILLFGLLLAGIAAARDFSPECRAQLKNRRLTLVVPHAAGGGFDAYARALAPVLERHAGARVTISNLPNRVQGMQAIAQGGDEALRIGILEASTLMQLALEGEGGLRLDEFDPLGAVTSEFQAWIGRAGATLADFQPTRPLIAAASAPASNIVEVGLTAHLFGQPLRVISGYHGSQDMAAAVLRREADILSVSVSSAQKLARSGDLQPLLLLSDRPLAHLPGVPWLAGPGGEAERRLVGRGAAARQQAAELAATIVDLSQTFRVIFVATRVSAPLRACLASLAGVALFDDEFARAAGAVGREVAPLDAGETRRRFDRVVAGSRAYRPLIQRLIEESQRAGR